MSSAYVVLRRLQPGADAPTRKAESDVPQPVSLTPDSGGRTTAYIRAGQYAVRSIGIGYVERHDTVLVRAGFADTLQLDMRRRLVCLF